MKLPKNAIPYWAVLLVDSLILFCSGVFAYWMFNLTDSLVDNWQHVVCTLLLDVGISWMGFKLFHTFSGMIRYSSFDDLLRVACANATSLVMALLVLALLKWQHIETLTALSYAETVVTFFLTTMLMWLERVVVKALFDETPRRISETRVPRNISCAVSSHTTNGLESSCCWDRRFIMWTTT